MINSTGDGDGDGGGGGGFGFHGVPRYRLDTRYRMVLHSLLARTLLALWKFWREESLANPASPKFKSTSSTFHFAAAPAAVAVAVAEP